MVQKTRLLIIAQDLMPYTDESELISRIAERIPHVAGQNGMEIRILMPKFGTINERRHRLHEVVRLSGMNIIVDNDDYPLIIKVASLPGSRIQVYFLDNDEFFRRKTMFNDDDGVPFADNADRMIFFCKGALEIVKKFGWAPDIIHCQGFMTTLIPFYIKTAYMSEPLFRDAKIVASLYDESYDKHFTGSFNQKASINQLTAADLAVFQDGDGGIDLRTAMIKYVDGVIVGSESILSNVIEIAEKVGTPVCPYNEDEYAAVAEYVGFYRSLMAQPVA